MTSTQNHETHNKNVDNLKTTVADAPQEIIEKAIVCPACSYTSGEGEFECCPKCGIIIKKYFLIKKCGDKSNKSLLVLCMRCGNELGLNHLYCQKCGMARHENERSSDGIVIFLVMTAIVIATIGAILMFVQPDKDLSLPPPTIAVTPIKAPDERTTAPAPVVPAPHRQQVPEPPPAEQEPAKPSEPTDEMPHAIVNSLGITRVAIVFSSNSKDEAPENNSISMGEGQIYAHIKMLVPYDKTYIKMGKLYDSDENLVMNVTGKPYTATQSIWFAWFRHKFDKSFERPGIWRFELFINGEKIAEEHVVVTN